jgi:hypothetical protein
MRLRQLSFLVVAFFSMLPRSVAAQNGCSLAPPYNFITQLQAGQVQFQFVGPAVTQAIMQQTGGTGRDLRLASLGPIANIIVTNTQIFPGGIVCTYKVQFQNSVISWQMANDANGIVQGLNYGLIGPPPSESSDNGNKPVTPPPAAPKTEEDACKLYPNMC